MSLGFSEPQLAPVRTCQIHAKYYMQTSLANSPSMCFSFLCSHWILEDQSAHSVGLPLTEFTLMAVQQWCTPPLVNIFFLLFNQLFSQLVIQFRFAEWSPGVQEHRKEGASDHPGLKAKWQRNETHSVLQGAK